MWLLVIFGIGLLELMQLRVRGSDGLDENPIAYTCFYRLCASCWVSWRRFLILGES